MLPFHMSCLSDVLHGMQPQDWFMSVDLHDAYFHVTIEHRCFLRFVFHSMKRNLLRMPSVWASDKQTSSSLPVEWSATQCQLLLRMLGPDCSHDAGIKRVSEEAPNTLWKRNKLYLIWRREVFPHKIGACMRAVLLECVPAEVWGDLMSALSLWDLCGSE